MSSPPNLVAPFSYTHVAFLVTVSVSVQSHVNTTCSPKFTVVLLYDPLGGAALVEQVRASKKVSHPII